MPNYMQYYTLNGRWTHQYFKKYIGAKICSFACKIGTQIPHLVSTQDKNMTKKISRAKGETVALAILDMDVQWAAIFADLEMTDLNYSDLFMRMWMARDVALTKTALYDFMPGVSRRTAVRYVQNLVDNGWLIERPAEDKRIKYVDLSIEINTRLERFLDFAFDRLGRIKA
jgi:hypothetical protein